MATPFQIKKPCEICPFRKDVTPFLTRERCQSIVDGVREDDHFSFPCHETTGVKGPKRVPRKEWSQCAGFSALLWRERQINVAMRLGLVLKMLTVEQLEANARIVFKSFKEFVEHHGQG